MRSRRAKWRSFSVSRLGPQAASRGRSRLIAFPVVRLGKPVRRLLARVPGPLLQLPSQQVLAELVGQATLLEGTAMQAVFAEVRMLAVAIGHITA